VFRETIVAYIENHKKPINIIRGQNIEIFRVKTGGTYTAVTIVFKGCMSHLLGAAPAGTLRRLYSTHILLHPAV
jgi:hypothetical protein